MMQNQAAHGDEQENNLEQENGHGELLLDFLHPVARLIKMRHLRGRNRTMSPEEIHQQDVCIGQLQRLNNATILYCSHLREILVLKVAQELNCLRPDIIVRIPDATDFIQAVQEIKGVTTLPAGIHKQTESHRILHLVPMNVPKPEAVMESVLETIKRFKDHLWAKAYNEGGILSNDYLMDDLKEVHRRLQGAVPEITSIEVLEVAILLKRLLGQTSIYNAPSPKGVLATIMQRLATSEGITLAIDGVLPAIVNQGR